MLDVTEDLFDLGPESLLFMLVGEISALLTRAFHPLFNFLGA